MDGLSNKINEVYKEKLEREADNEGMKFFYEKITLGNLTIEQLPKEIEASVEYQYLQNWKKGYTVTKEGFDIYVNPNDQVISKTICFSGTWEPTLAKFFKKKIKIGMTVLDIGAQIGFFSLLFSKLVKESGKVISFEPSPENFNVLKKNLEISPKNNIVAIQKAISDTNESQKLFLSKDNFGDNRLEGKPVFDVDYHREAIRVDSVTLDDYCQESKVDFCKIDVQGAEMKILEGASKVIKNNPNMELVIEFAPSWLDAMGTKPIVFLKKIEKLGFFIYDLYNTENEKINNLELLCSRYTGESFTDLYLTRKI